MVGCVVVVVWWCSRKFELRAACSWWFDGSASLVDGGVTSSHW